MAEYIYKMVKASDPQSIQKYVKNHLPNDPVSLERIYKQLLKYDTDSEASKVNKSVKRSMSLHSINSRKGSIQSKDSLERHVQKTSNMLQMLRDKGLKPVGDCEQEGQALFLNQKQRLTKPLLPNAKLLKSEEAAIDRLIHKYTLNRQFYNRQQQDPQKQNEADPQMTQFLTRRKSVLDSINNQHFKANSSKLFKGIQSKVYGASTGRTSFQKMPVLLKSTATDQTKNLISICADELQKKTFTQIHPQKNEFISLDERTNFQFGPVTPLEVENTQAFRKKIQADQLQRYTTYYMSLMTKRIKSVKKCKLTGYDKDLIKDEKKLRKVIQF